MASGKLYDTLYIRAFSQLSCCVLPGYGASTGLDLAVQCHSIYTGTIASLKTDLVAIEYEKS